MASSIVTSAAQQLGGLLVHEAKWLYEVSDKIDRLQRDLQWMHCFLEDADNRQHSEKVVAMWVSEIRDFAYEAEEIVEKYVHQVSHPRRNGKRNTIRWLMCALCDAQALHEVGSNIDDLRSRITELLSRLQLVGVQITKENKSEHYFATREQRQTYSHIDEDPVGLQKDTRALVQKLMMDEEVRVVSVCGMGGLGKTTLARQVFRDKTARQHFKNRVWVCISKQFETREVFREILKELINIKGANEKAKHDIEKMGCDLEKTELSDLTDVQVPEKICEILKQNACLVVVDDVWNRDDWNALKPAFDSIRSSASKVLITTRNSSLIQDETSFEYCYKLNLLDDDDSWELFQRIAFAEREIKEIESEQTKEDGDMKTKKKLGKEMLKHCKGLPLAIITLGGVLCSKKSVAEWEAVKTNVASYLMKHGSESSGLFGILELSFKDLPFYLKPCFMYLGHFPEDYTISVDRLYHLWEAEGLVTKSGSDEDDVQDMSLDDLAESYLKELLERGLVQVAKTLANGKISKVRVHDVMRDMCLKKCNEVHFLSIIKYGRFSSEEASSQITSSSRVDRKLRRCAVYLGDAKDDDPPIDPSLNSAPCIRSLLVFQLGPAKWKKECLTTSKMRKSLSCLRVLDLESVSSMLVQPKISKHFIHLRYLSFKNSEVVVEKLHIWDCKFLETLDLRSIGGVTISNKFWKLSRLRHLYLPIWMELRGWKKLFLTDAQLQQMETLVNFDVRVCRITDLGKMTSLRVFSMKCLGLSMEDMTHFLKSPAVAKKHLVKPLHLIVDGDVINKLATTSLATEMRSFKFISGFKIRGRIQTAANLEILNQVYLTKLELWNTGIGQEGMTILERLPYLKKLHLFLNSVAGTKMSFSDGGFLQLKVLGLHLLKELEEWEVGDQGTLPNLETLHIYHCKKLKMIPDGLPKSVVVTCYCPCISGVEKYNICPHAQEQAD